MLIVDVAVADYIVKLWIDNPHRPKRSYSAIAKWNRSERENDEPVSAEDARHLMTLVEKHSKTE